MRRESTPECLAANKIKGQAYSHILGQSQQTSGLDHELGNIQVESVGTRHMKTKPSKTKADQQPITAAQRGQAAAKAMNRQFNRMLD
jgi:hypothetical protein